MTQQHQSDGQAVQFSLHQSGRAAIYARVARGARLTQEPQTKALIALANERGYPNEHIIVYEDVGVSGRSSIAKRGALSALVSELTKPEPEEGNIQIILVTSVERLFRDADAVDIALFVETCTQQGVQLVTPEMTYDFQNAAHAALFRFRCEQSTMFIEQAIQKRLRGNRMQTGRKYKAKQ